MSIVTREHFSAAHVSRFVPFHLSAVCLWSVFRTNKKVKRAHKDDTRFSFNAEMQQMKDESIRELCHCGVLMQGGQDECMKGEFYCAPCCLPRSPDTLGCSLESCCYPSAGVREAEKRLRHSAVLHTLIHFFYSPHSGCQSSQTFLTETLLLCLFIFHVKHMQKMNMNRECGSCHCVPTCCSVVCQTLTLSSQRDSSGGSFLALYCPLLRPGCIFNTIWRDVNRRHRRNDAESSVRRMNRFVRRLQ